MLITPNGKLRLCSVPIDNSYLHQIYFSSKANQTSYFASKAVYNFDSEDFSYMQKDGVLRVNKNADQLYSCNYVMYQNTAFSNRWFYGFITSIEWISDGSAEVRFETDVWQTWHFDYSFKKSFVIREHVTSDDIGEHTTEEGLELGEYVINSQAMGGLHDLRIVLATTVTNPSSGSAISSGGIYGGTYSGSSYIVFPFSTVGATNLSDFLKDLTSAGRAEAVTAIFVCPAFLVGGVSSGTMLPNTNLGSEKETITPLSVPTTINGYTPRNNKLLTYPYSFCYCHNNNGSAGTFPFEYFKNRLPVFDLIGTLTPNPTILLAPKNYKGLITNLDESLSLGGFPLLSWQYDTYKAWQAQHGASAVIGTIGTTVGAGAAVAAVVGTGGAALPIVGGVLGALASATRLVETSKQPPQARGNALSGSTNTANKTNDFAISHKSIKAEYAKKIDEFFDMFGYKVNRVKSINFNSRPHWNYVQVNDLNVTGPVPSPDIVKLKGVFQKGITFWKNGDNLGNYSLDNR